MSRSDDPAMVCMPRDALEALVDFESWARMREYFGLSVEEACNVWIQAIDRLLPPTPADS